MHFRPRDVDTITIVKSKDVGGLMRRLKVFAEKDGLSYKRTYLSEWTVRKDKRSPSRGFPAVAEQFIVRTICKNLEASLEDRPLPDLEITCFTTHKTDGYIYHAHPDCHGKTWYDWVNINFLYHGNSKPICVPGHILMFVDFHNSVNA